MTDLLQPLTDTIRKVRCVINKHEDKISKSEIRTRNVLIDPVLRALGWDVSVLEDVEVEYLTQGRKKVDYALLGSDQRPAVLIEAKRLNEPPDSKNLSQLLAYCVEVGAQYGILTDGNSWEMYDTSKPIPIEQKRTMHLVLTSQQPAIATKKMLDLWKDYVREGGLPHAYETNAI